MIVQKTLSEVIVGSLPIEADKVTVEVNDDYPTRVQLDDASHQLTTLIAKHSDGEVKSALNICLVVIISLLATIKSQEGS